MKREKYLSAEEEHDLAVKAKAGDERARHRIIENVMPMAARYALKRCRGKQSRDDMVQAAFVGLCRAFDKFDPARGFRYSTYAMSWVHLEVHTEAYSGHMMITSRARIDAVNRMLKDQRENGSADVDVAGKRIKMKSSSVAALRNALRPPASDVDFDLLTSGSSSDVSAEEDDSFHRVVEALSVLDERSREIVWDRYLDDEPQTLAEIGARHGLSRERIRQIEEAALAKVRKHVERKRDDFLP